MKTFPRIVLSLAVASSLPWLTACEGDQSAPTRPRTQNLLVPNEKAQENADKRINEPPAREFQTSGKEFPGASKAAPAPGDSIITADAQSPATTEPAMVAPATTEPVKAELATTEPAKAETAKTKHAKTDPAQPVAKNGSNACLPEARYNRDFYPGPLPHLPSNPGSVPMTGSTPVPGTDMSVEYDWGQVVVLKDYPHRDWPTVQTTYVAGAVKHNPVMYFPLQQNLNVPQTSGTYGGDWVNNLYEIPWFYGQLVALPVYMCIQCPWGQVTTQRLGYDPTFFGHLPATGDIVPSPPPGVIRWEYPFLREAARDMSTMPAAQPIAPTPGITAPPPGAIQPSPTTLPAEDANTPGLR